jgi:hypothetical protein
MKYIARESSRADLSNKLDPTIIFLNIVMYKIT